MIGLGVAAVGWVCVVVALVVLLGLWVLAGAGAVMVVVGLVVDLDAVKEWPNGKRDQPAPPRR